MKKRERSVEVADLLPIAHLNGDLVIFIDSEEGNLPSSFCVQANFDTLLFGPVMPKAAYIELNMYVPIHDIDMQISYRQRIHDEMSPDVIAAMLKEFTQKYLQEQDELGVYNINHPDWEPGG